MCRLDYADHTINILKDTNRTARKAYKCFECAREIKPGEVYNYQAGKGDGFEIFRTCLHCVAPRNLLLNECHGFLYGEVGEDLYDHIDAKEWGYTAARFYVGIRRQWKRFKSDELMPIPKAY